MKIKLRELKQSGTKIIVIKVRTETWLDGHSVIASGAGGCGKYYRCHNTLDKGSLLLAIILVVMAMHKQMLPSLLGMALTASGRFRLHGTLWCMHDLLCHLHPSVAMPLVGHAKGEITCWAC